MKWRTGCMLWMGWAMVANAQSDACHAPVSAQVNPNIPKGDFSAAVQLGNVPLTPTTIGFGATANRADEITLVDGRWIIVHHGKDKLDVRQPNPQDGAVVLVTGSPMAWREAGKIADIHSVSALDFALENAVEDMGCDEKAVVPFKLLGHANRIKWSVATSPNSDREQTSQDVEVVIVGIHTKTDKSRWRMAKGYNLHAHVYFPQTGLAGHLEEIDLQGSGTLYLPAAR